MDAPIHGATAGAPMPLPASRATGVPIGGQRPRRACTCSTTARSLIVCIDDVPYQASTMNTNAVELCRRLIRDERQVIFYHAGLGGTTGLVRTPWGHHSRVLGSAMTSSHFQQIVVTAYLWLVKNWETEDRIYLLGFARGAYQVRALSAMIQLVGLLDKGNIAQTPLAYQLYTGSKDKSDVKTARKHFRDTFSRRVRVHFLGAWDTASPANNETLPGTTRGLTHVCFFRHALALHERRVAFRPLYARGDVGPLPREVEATEDLQSHTKEVWFAGSSSDLGGQAVGSNFGPALRWMIFEGVLAGMRFSEEPINWDTRATDVHHQRTGSRLLNYILHSRSPRQIQRNQLIHDTVFGATLARPTITTVDLEEDDLDDYSLYEPLVQTTSPSPSWYARLSRLLTNATGVQDPVVVESSDYRSLPSSERGSVSAASSDAMVHTGPLDDEATHNMRERLARLLFPHFRRRRPQGVGSDVNSQSADSLLARLPNGLQWNEEHLRSSDSSVRVEIDPYTTIRCALDRIKEHVLANVAVSSLNSEVLVLKDLGCTVLGRRSLRDSRDALNILISMLNLCILQSRGMNGVATGARSTTPLIDTAQAVTSLIETCNFPLDGPHIRLLPGLRRLTDVLAHTDQSLSDHLWHLFGNNPLVGHLRTKSTSIWSLTYLPGGGKIVASSVDRVLRICDLDSGEIPVWADVHSNSIESIALSPDGTLVASAGWDHTLRIWDARTGSPVGDPLRGHTHWVRAVAFSPDNARIVSGSHDRTIRIWDIESGATVVGPIDGHNGSIHAVAFSPDGSRIISGSADTTIRIWDATTGRSADEPFRGHTDWVCSVAVSPSGIRVASASRDGTVRVWDAATGKTILGPLTGGGGKVNSIAYSPDGNKFASGEEGGVVCLWDAVTGHQLDRFQGNQGWVWSVAFSPDGKQVASGACGGTLCIWDATGEWKSGMASRNRGQN